MENKEEIILKSILLIGLGRFGRHIAEKLNELNHQVLAVDKQEDRVEAVLPFVTSGQIGDSTNIEFYSLWELEILMCASWRSVGISKALWKQRPI